MYIVFIFVSCLQQDFVILCVTSNTQVPLFNLQSTYGNYTVCIPEWQDMFDNMFYLFTPNKTVPIARFPSFLFLLSCLNISVTL